MVKRLSMLFLLCIAEFSDASRACRLCHWWELKSGKLLSVRSRAFTVPRPKSTKEAALVALCSLVCQKAAAESLSHASCVYLIIRALLLVNWKRVDKEWRRIRCWVSWINRSLFH